VCPGAVDAVEMHAISTKICKTFYGELRECSNERMLSARGVSYARPKAVTEYGKRVCTGTYYNYTSTGTTLYSHSSTIAMDYNEMEATLHDPGYREAKSPMGITS
jgi:hypothetical protein